MSGKINDGGGAFPHPTEGRWLDETCTRFEYQTGMSLRDWFAGMALQGLCSNNQFLVRLLDKERGEEGEDDHAVITRVSTRLADFQIAALAAREGKEDK